MIPSPNQAAYGGAGFQMPKATPKVGNAWHEPRARVKDKGARVRTPDDEGWYPTMSHAAYKAKRARAAGVTAQVIPSAHRSDKYIPRRRGGR